MQLQGYHVRLDVGLPLSVSLPKVICAIDDSASISCILSKECGSPKISFKPGDSTRYYYIDDFIQIFMRGKGGSDIAHHDALGRNEG